MKTAVLQYCWYSSPVGTLLLAGDENGLQRIQFENAQHVDPNWQENPPFFAEVVQQLQQYFDKQRQHFDLKLNPVGTDFQQSVWGCLQKIPYGQTQYYAQIAEALDSPKAARAIGMANNKNPIPIIIPCHRVIGKNGSLTGFAGGLDIKQRLLALEFQF